MKIFISYAGKDETLSDGWISSFSKMIENEIFAMGYNSDVEVFFANYSIESGEKFREKYLSYLNNDLDYFIPFLSPQYFQSKYCIEEISSILDLIKQGAKCKIIPIFFIGLLNVEELFANIKNQPNLSANDIEELKKEICERKYLDWREARFNISSPLSKRSISDMAAKLIGSSRLKNNHPIVANTDSIQHFDSEQLSAANNNDTYVRQENQYENALSALFDKCVSQLTEEDSVYILDLDYRNVQGIEKHLKRYEQLKKKLGQLFVLCMSDDEKNEIEQASLKHVSPFVLSDKFSVEQIIHDWKNNGYPKPNIIYADRNYRKFKDPVHDYIIIRRHLLSESGSIIIKGFDDGSKICYPDPDNVMDSIIKATANKKNVSDRFNARKIFNHFKLAGFQKFDREYIINDTIEMDVDQRYDLYEESFDFRKDYFDKGSSERIQMEKWLSCLRDCFCNDCFYYCETNYFISATKL